MKIASHSRRDFLKKGSILSGGLLVSFFVPAHAKNLVSEATDTIFTPNAYLSIGTDNTVKVLLAHVEMGQGIWTTLTMFIAEELDVDINKIKVEHAPPSKSYIHLQYGIQSTGGSSSTTTEFERYRKAGASARLLLVEAAAQKLGVSPTTCRTENGFVISGDKRLSYGELAETASKMTLPTEIPLKDAKNWKYIGKSVPRLDGKIKVTGQAKYGIDVQMADLLTAVVAHPPVFGATIRSYDDKATKAINGIIDVVQIPSGVAVLANNFWTAKKGCDALKIEWNLGVGENLDSKTQFDDYRKIANTKGNPAQEAGNVEEGFAKASNIVEAEYIFPYLAHACMEPMNCTVKLTSENCEIWAGIQSPMLEQAAAAKILGFTPEQVTVNTTFMGGAFGRRTSFTSDFVVEAVHIAKASGKNIKLVFTRENDMKAGYYRPAFLHKVKVGLNEKGLPIAWKHNIVGQSIHEQGTPYSHFIKNGIDGTSVEGVRNSPYLVSVPNQSIELHSTKAPVPVLWWRSVGHTHTGFTMEAMIDELAHTAKTDPIAYRKSLLTSKRHLETLALVEEKSGWSKPLPTGRFRGVAIHESFGTFVAYVVEISIQKGQLRVHKVTCAVDCGFAVNPDGVKAQIEGSIIFGLTAFLYGEISLEKGQVQQSNFHDYQILRMNEAPKIAIHLVGNNEKMGGAGEPGVPPIGPALANAIFAATGKRVRKMPIQASDLVKS